MVNVVRVATVDEVCRAAAAEFVRVVRERPGGVDRWGCRYWHVAVACRR